MVRNLTKENILTFFLKKEEYVIINSSSNDLRFSSVMIESDSTTMLGCLRNISSSLTHCYYQIDSATLKFWLIAWLWRNLMMLICWSLEGVWFVFMGWNLLFLF